MLTKKQRLECYTYIYLCLLAGVSPMYNIGHHFGDYVSDWVRINMINTGRFTELIAQRPKHVTGSSWWPANNISARIRAVERAIAMCEEAAQ